MADSSDEEFPMDWVPYSCRKEWSDVKPLSQNDGPNPVVVIAYSEKFKDVYDYFRAVVNNREKSLRALELTKDAIKLNAANYTVWQYRRDIIKELSLSLVEELDYAEEVITNNPKNYQVWHHRRVIVEWLNNPSRELQLTADILNLDAKNYHAWQHRQWAIKTYNLFEDELAYTDKLISDDVRNNSAWNQRYFVLEYTGFPPEVLQREIMFVMNRIRFVKNNESSWNYLRGILEKGDGTMDQFPEVVEFAEELYESGVTSPYLVAFLIDLYDEKCIRSYEPDNVDGDVEKSDKHLEEKVTQLCHLMATDYDTIRKKYWQYVSDHFLLRLKKVQRKHREQKEQLNNPYRESSAATDETTSESYSSPV